MMQRCPRRRKCGVQAFAERQSLKPTGFTPGGLGKIMGPPADESPLGNNAQNPTYINTVWGYGYKWGF